MQCPKCRHKWTVPKKVKYIFNYHETGPNEIFEQICVMCDKMIKRGSKAMACTSIPQARHIECGKNIPIANWVTWQKVDVI